MDQAYLTRASLDAFCPSLRDEESNRCSFNPTRPMAAQSDRPALKAAQEALKALDDAERAHVLAWICRYYDDRGAMFAPTISSARRQRIEINGVAHWLVRVPRSARP